MKKSYGQNVHIIGFAGTEGAALLHYLRNKFPRAKLTAHNFCAKENFLHDFRNAHLALRKEEALEKGREILDLEGVRYCFQDEYLKRIEEAETIFVPQSWYLYEENKILKKYQDKFRSITRLYFDLFPGKIIGVTGSNGKTTTANLIAEIMQRAYPSTALGTSPSTLYTGNDRRAEQVLERLESAKEDDWLVMEISNRQLKLDLGKSPDISVITNITPNHLTEHKDFADYAATKASLIKYQTENQWSVLNNDDPESRKLIEIDSGETMPFSFRELLPKGVFVQFNKIKIKHAEKEEELMDTSEFPLLGEHNLSNALAATAACYLAGVDLELIAQTLRSVKPIHQRMELIREFDGVRYYNDSASTVPQSTIAAIKTLKQPGNKIILILGGRSKGTDYSDLAKVIDNHNVETVMLKSPVADELGAILNKKSIVVENLKEAINLAKKSAEPNDCVLFSPAGEFFVYFKDKMADYKQFRHIVNSL